MIVSAPRGPSGLRAMRELSGREPARVPRFFAAAAARYGDYATWKIGRHRFVLVSEPAGIEAFLVSRARSFEKGRGFERLARLLGTGLLTARGDLHLRRRRLLQPAFHRERIAGYAAIMAAEAVAFADARTAGETTAIDAALRELTLRIVARTLFGGDVTGADAATIGAALEDAQAVFPIAIGPFGELFDLMPFLPIARRFAAAKLRLDGVIGGITAARRASGAAGDDLLGMLLAARDEEGLLDDEAVRAEALTIFLAGHETTTHALTWSLLLLAEHPAEAARVAAELDAVLGDRDAGFEDVERLPRTRAVLAEAMRLFPPAWVLGRRATETVTLGGVTLQRGDVAFGSQWVVHRDARWWPQPLAFRPERWLDGSAEAVPAYAYFPFGGGNRRCIGDRFAWAEGILVLAALLRRWTLARADADPIPLQPAVTLRPGRPVALVLQRRPTARQAGAHP